MGQARHSGRRATLDDRKRRAAGRVKQQGPEVQAIRDAYTELPAKGKTAGAFGKDDRANPRGGQTAAISGGGGGATVPSKDAPIETPRSTRPSRKRSA